MVPTVSDQVAIVASPEATIATLQGLPTYENYICEYVTGWMQIKLNWKLSIAEDESTAIGAAISEHYLMESF